MIGFPTCERERGDPQGVASMKQWCLRGAALGLLLALVAGLVSTGAAADEFKPEEGFVSLFNGKDLTGWVYTPASKASLEGKTETPDQRIEVKNGVIVMNEKDKDGKGGIKDLYTVRPFPGQFVLRLQFRAAPRADSGVYIRGTQLQVRDYPTVGPYKEVKGFKNGDWNDLEITVGGKVDRVFVNGKALEGTDVFELTVKDGKPVAKLNGKETAVTSYQYKKDVCLALCKNNGEVLEKAFEVPAKGGALTGGIGLQAETGKFEFRNIRVKAME
jgi:hypothetical protein